MRLTLKTLQRLYGECYSLFRGIFKKGEPVLEGIWEKVDGKGDQISIGPMGVFLTDGGKIRYKTNTYKRPGATGSWQDLAGGLTYISSGKLIIV